LDVVKPVKIDLNKQAELEATSQLDCYFINDYIEAACYKDSDPDDDED
jgi:hypothetical protein